jgi:hypothetical protein
MTSRLGSPRIGRVFLHPGSFIRFLIYSSVKWTVFLPVHGRTSRNTKKTARDTTICWHNKCITLAGLMLNRMRIAREMMY